MEIQAKLSFRHGLIMKTLNNANISIKDLSDMCGWNYQNLLCFINFRHIPKCENRESLFFTLKAIDNTISEEDIFPEIYNKIKGFLKTRSTIRDIPVENLLSCNPDKFAIEDKTENRLLLKIDMKKAFKEIKHLLNEREKTVIKMSFGFGKKEAYTLDEIGEEVRVSRERVRQIKERALNKLKNKLQKYKGIYSLDINDEIGIDNTAE